MTELRPCPFCGDVAKVVDLGGKYAVECSKKCAATIIKTDLNKVVEIWNRRGEEV